MHPRKTTCAKNDNLHQKLQHTLAATIKMRGCVIFVVVFCLSYSFATEDSKNDHKVDEEKIEYAKGSVCGYCSYCKVNRSSAKPIL